MPGSSFILPGMDNIVKKIVPNFDGTYTVFFTIKGVDFTHTFPIALINGFPDLDAGSAHILSHINAQIKQIG